MTFKGFDFLRAIGMLAVIYIHASDTNELTRGGMKWLGFAVPCFFLMSAFLAQHHMLQSRSAFRTFVSKRLKRLAPPFLAWSAVYLLVRYAKSIATGQSLDADFVGVVFWGDASHQLYFVPLLFYFLVAWLPTMLLARRQQLAVGTIYLVAIALAVSFETPIDERLNANRWFIAKNLVWFPLGALTAILVNYKSAWIPKLAWPSILTLLALFVAGQPQIHLFSLAVFFLAISVTSDAPKPVQFLSRYSFGVYLVHVLLIEVMQFIAPKMGADVSTLAVTVGIMGLAAVLSYGICFALGQHKMTRWSVR